MPATDTISDVIAATFDTFSDQLWLLAPIGLGVAIVIWGLPKGVAFVKKLAK